MYEFLLFSVHSNVTFNKKVTFVQLFPYPGPDEPYEVNQRLLREASELKISKKVEKVQMGGGRGQRQKSKGPRFKTLTF